MCRKSLAIVVFAASMAMTVESVGCGPSGSQSKNVSQVATADSDAFERARVETDRFHEQKKAEEAKSRSRTRHKLPVDK